MELVRKAREKALKMMHDAGFDIGRDVDVVIDQKLPFMGHTVPQRGRFKIVVSRMAIESSLPVCVIDMVGRVGFRGSR